MEYTWDLVTLYKKWKEVDQQTQGLQIEKVIKCFLIYLQSKELEYLKLLNEIFMFVTIQNRKYIWFMDWKIAKIA